MRLAIQRRAEKMGANQDLLNTFEKISKIQISAEKYAVREDKFIAIRIYYASSKCQAMVRGYLARRYYRRLLEKNRTIRTIQRVIRGKLGRIRWWKQYWISQSVVKSATALEEIMKRSAIVRTANAPGKRGDLWTEYFDPLSESFWYLNARTMLNTWKCPLPFQRDLVCAWDGFHEFGGMPSQGKCRRVCSSVSDYHIHLKSHKWYCPACDHKNTGVAFPRCSLCSNAIGFNGEDANKVLKDSVNSVRNKLAFFLVKEKSAKNHESYDLRERLINVAVARQKQIDREEEENNDHWTNLLTSKTADVVGVDNSSSQSRRQQVGLEAASSLSSSTTKTLKFPAIRGSFPSVTAINSSPSAGISSDPAAASINSQNIQPTNRSKLNKKALQTPSLTMPSNHAFSLLPPTEAAVSSSSSLVSMSIRSIASIANAKDREKEKNFADRDNRDGEEFADYNKLAHDPIRAGIIPPLIFDEITRSTKGNSSATYFSRQFESIVKSFEQGDDISVSTTTETESNASNTRPASILSNDILIVCEKFLIGECSKTSCPQAHPGLRDSAVVDLTRLSGTVIKVPIVRVCENYSNFQNNAECGGCVHGAQCSKYHIYIKPSVQEIISKIYPIEKGTKTKKFRGGANFNGNVKRGKFDGYGVMVWNDSSTYLGNWQNNMRHGFGVFRDANGSEYVGLWQEGKRHGSGIYSNLNGEEYVGEWANGKMEGVGKLTTAYGDTYSGSFRNHKYHGMGMFEKKNGDRFMGFLENGFAHGLGILSLSTGEKYKGYFEKNSRHGKGVCSFEDGSRFAGEWYRGQMSGFGIYLSPEGEKYVGQMESSKKHGKGRQFFKNGDFFDGEFFKDSVKGVGVYYHANGNCYSGQWHDNMRNGLGTYIFSNGSRYTGYWLNNKIHGKGKFDFSNGCFYRGNFIGNKKQGKGVLTWRNTNVYKGDFVNDKLCGFGEMNYFLGHRYVGAWIDNRKHGIGTFLYSQGHMYEGSWVADVKNGKGKMSYLHNSAAEESYEGDWSNDIKNGNGKYIYRADEGTTYEGEWHNGIRHGKGLLTYKDGSYYRGEFQNEQMWGKGVYVGSDGSQYDGQWRKNMRQGIGTEIGTNGSIYSGQFWANMKHGKGQIINLDGTSYEGNWEGNVILGKGVLSKPVGKGPGGGPNKVSVVVFGY